MDLHEAAHNHTQVIENLENTLAKLRKKVEVYLAERDLAIDHLCQLREENDKDT